MIDESMAQGAFPSFGKTTFRIWAPHAPKLAVVIESGARSGSTLELHRREDGYHQLTVEKVGPNDRYRYQFPDGRLRADPAARLQEGSVHGTSTVIDLAFAWTDQQWAGIPLEHLIFYEIHPGTFTTQGHLDAVIDRLDAIKDLGITALQLMPVAAFDGHHNWGYDGVLLFAVHAAYGGPRALQRLVDAAHAKGLAVFIDAVYNHLGPSGNYLREFGPYFTSRYQTPWGEAVNYDGADARPVREFFIQNALSWINDFHADGLRLDAIHGIFDQSNLHILQELKERTEQLARQLGRPVHIIAESDLNEPRVITPTAVGGWGLDAQWSDDFHHALHALLTGERQGYYADFGGLEQLAKAYRQGFVLDGQYSTFRGRPHGRSAQGIPGRRLVVAAQNHDQVGNRTLGDRLAATLATESLRLVAAATILSPFLPLLFMGEEYAEPAPFQYFTSFPDQELGRAVTAGRQREFESFNWRGPIPDPQDFATFLGSHINFGLSRREPHAAMRRFYQALIACRRQIPALNDDNLEHLEVTPVKSRRILLIRRPGPEADALLVLRFAPLSGQLRLPPGNWTIAIDSWAEEFSGTCAWSIPPGPVAPTIRLGPFHALLLLSSRLGTTVSHCETI